jgi:hypothetical protein
MREKGPCLAEIGNSKEETRGTQFRQVRAARCVIPYVLIGCDYKMIKKYRHGLGNLIHPASSRRRAPPPGRRRPRRPASRHLRQGA